MTFLVTLIALSIERFFDWSHLRHWQWFNAYQRVFYKMVNQAPSYLLFFASLAPLVFSILLVEAALHHVLFGLGGLIFQAGILVYCLGPKNFWVETFVAMNASRPENFDAKLFFDTIFSQANQRVFAVIFWFVVLGPAGAFLYRVISLATMPTTEYPSAADIAQKATTVEAMMDWVPVRLLTFIFALGGHFSKVITCWRKKILVGSEGNQVLLSECGAAALGGSEDVLVNGSIERQAVSLLDRSLIIAIVLVAIVTLVL